MSSVLSVKILQSRMQVHQVVVVLAERVVQVNGSGWKVNPNKQPMLIVAVDGDVQGIDVRETPGDSIAPALDCRVIELMACRRDVHAPRKKE